MTAKTHNCLSLGDALRAAREDETRETKITNASVGTAFGASAPTGERIIRGEWDDRAEQWRDALRSPLAPIVGSVLTCGTAYRLVARDSTRDLDGDGSIDRDDVVLGMAKSLQLASQAIVTHTQLGSGRRYMPGDLERLVKTLDESIAALETAKSNALALSPGGLRMARVG